ncbi:hypothetical protein AVEN_123778-1 [Araneus ventricosus]|uniref:Uncharacterized protein n=1 Tax=Araneus ventricosus TaxID=182803 RepID=A0A4Y2BK06_ARAVE|nr:hypothetical protein AVEN_123778-1 [Araneus ventricosus]
MNADNLFIVAERAVGLGLAEGYVDVFEKGFPGNEEAMVLYHGTNMVVSGKLSLVEDSGSGGLGLSSGVVADLIGDGFDLRKPRSKSCHQDTFLVSGDQDFGRVGVVKVIGLNLSPDQEVLVWELKNIWLDCLRYSEEGGDWCFRTEEATALLASSATDDHRKDAYEPT